MTSPAFTERILVAILFENTADRDVDGHPIAESFASITGFCPLKLATAVKVFTSVSSVSSSQNL
jgi:hypothetical protein